MGQITIRLPDEQERHLKNIAEKNGKKLAQYARELLELGAQVEMSARENEKINNQSASLQTLYLMRYLIKRIFKEEGECASRTSSEKADEELKLI